MIFGFGVLCNELLCLADTIAASLVLRGDLKGNSDFFVWKLAVCLDLGLEWTIDYLCFWDEIMLVLTLLWG